MACQVNGHPAPSSIPEGLLHLCGVSYLHFLPIPATNTMCATDYLPVKFSPLHSSKLLILDNEQTAWAGAQIKHCCNPQPPESRSSIIWVPYDFRDQANVDWIVESSQKNWIYSMFWNIMEFGKLIFEILRHWLGQKDGYLNIKPACSVSLCK